MATINGIISIDFEPLEQMIRKIVIKELGAKLDEGLKEINQTLISKREALLQEERFSIDQLAEILGINRRTIYNYKKDGTLPEPKRDISGHPYWTPDQIECALRLRGIKTKFPL